MLAALVTGAGAGPVAAGGCWLPPVDAPVVDPFREPACRWCPGNRGLEYGTRRGDPVRAVTTGTVTFAGEVAGTTYLVVRVPDGRRVTYGNMDGDPAGTRFAAGDVVVRGVTVGRAAGRFHLGVRTAGEGDGGEGDGYVDPAPLIGSWYRRPRLAPITADPPAPAPPPTLRCVASGTWPQMQQSRSAQVGWLAGPPPGGLPTNHPLAPQRSPRRRERVR